MNAPSDADLARIERALGWRPLHARPASAGRAGLSAARWIVADGERSAFVKLGTTDLTAGWFRQEHEVYLSLRDADLDLADVLGYADDGEVPVLALQDLSAATWPPPWDDGMVERVLATLDRVHAVPPPAHLRPILPSHLVGWPEVAGDPDRFLGIGLCSAQWLDAALPALIEAAATAPVEGSALLHLDVRSDNLCFAGDRTILVDWVAATVGDPTLEIAFWLPSLRAEGGPEPEAILPAAPELAALVAGYFCAQVGGPPIPEAPHVRPLQLMQARTALPWAARALGLPHPG